MQCKHLSKNDLFLHKLFFPSQPPGLPPCVSLSISFPPCLKLLPLLKTVIMFVVSLLPQAPPHKHISEQLSKMGVSACMLPMPNHNGFPQWSSASNKEQCELLGKKIASKVLSFSFREDNLDIHFPTRWHAMEAIRPLS